MTAIPEEATAQNYQLVDQKTLGTVADYIVWSEWGQKIKFGSLYAERKTVVVFIRLSPSFVAEDIELTQAIRSFFLRSSFSLFGE